MKRNTLTCLLFSSMFFILPVQAVTVYECVDSTGNSVFMDRCPPGTEKVSTRELSTGKKPQGPDLKSISSRNPITFYSVPDCDSCDLVRAYLNRRGLPITEKNVVDNLENQEELMEKSGALTVPVVTIGDATIKGYNKPVMETTLIDAGYPEEAEK